jgi:DNA helicase II / ATP-dependent DNA helicase PcrA
VRSNHPGDDITLILRSMTERLRHVMPSAQDWAQAFADVEAADAVTLMTVHRSKGLEYHTVFFLGLDDDQWWACEGTSTFFVGLSRAAHRLIFTSTSPAARSGKSRLCTGCSTRQAYPKPPCTDHSRDREGAPAT